MRYHISAIYRFNDKNQNECSLTNKNEKSSFIYRYDITLSIRYFERTVLYLQDIYGTPTRVSMWKCYCKVYWREFLLGGILKMMGDFVGYVGPLGVSVIVNFVAKNQNVTNAIEDEPVSVRLKMFTVNKLW